MTILLDDRTFNALAACAERTELSKGAIVRYSLTYYHAMVIAEIPMCANGQQCFCPQMHQRISAAQNFTPPAPPIEPANANLPPLDTSIIPHPPTTEAA